MHVATEEIFFVIECNIYILYHKTNGTGWVCAVHAVLPLLSSLVLGLNILDLFHASQAPVLIFRCSAPLSYTIGTIS